MRFIKKWLSFLLILFCIAGSYVQVRAAENEPSGEAAEKVPRIVFENAQNEEPDLYVTKHVQSADGQYEIPDDLEFTFILKLDGKLVNQLEYRVFDKNGAEVLKKDSNGNKIPFRTDRSGTFTLGPEQTAKFEYVGSGVSYEVTEVPLDGWEQIQPAGGMPAAGTVTDKGAWAEFTNMTGGDGGDTELMIQKTISFPDGYVSPETPDFTFVLLIDGAAYKREPYTITDMETGTQVGTGMTDDQGKFTLKGGQSALFQKVPEDVDYQVTEEATDGWRVTGSTSREGSTGSGGATLVNFNNASASFAVTKKMEDNSKPDVEFTFLLTTADRTVWEGAQYYLYNTNGEPVTNDDGQILSGRTDAKGNFKLKPGQTAIFTGIMPGTVYNVSEVGNPDYIQVVPSSASGYTDKVVSDAVEVLPFVNKPSEGGLTITKVLENEDGNAPLEQKEFAFVLSKKEGEGENAVYTPVPDAVYSVEVGGNQYTYKTDTEGTLRIKANETARFTGLAQGEYQVEEVDASYEYEPVEKVQSGIMSAENRNLSFTFTNVYTTRIFDLYVVKKGENNKLLEGAEFMLYRDEFGKNPVQDTPYISDAEGKITISNLKTGTYYLTEIKSPSGYQLLANPVKITVTWEKNVMQVTVDEKTVTSEDTDEQIYIRQNTNINDEVHITIYNSRNFILPITGGMGILTIAAMAAGMFFLFFMLLRMGKRKMSVTK